MSKKEENRKTQKKNKEGEKKWEVISKMYNIKSLNKRVVESGMKTSFTSSFFVLYQNLQL